MKLKDKSAIITGATMGFGKEAARRFLIEGASIVICSRNLNDLENTKKELNQYIKADNQKILIIKCDISNEFEVENLVNLTIKELGKIDILVNNAGIYGPKGSIEDIDWSEWKKAIEINLFGPMFLSSLVIPHMKKNNNGKIINLSGGGATNPMPKISAYAASKAAIVRMTETLAGECAGFNIDINSIAPGALNTRLLKEILESGPEKVGNHFYEKALKQKEEGGAPLDKGVSLCVFLASSESDGITGKLISAIWDPWENLQKYKDILNKSDIYTLRRIIPEDRNINWE